MLHDGYHLRMVPNIDGLSEHTMYHITIMSDAGIDLKTEKADDRKVTRLFRYLFPRF